MTGRTATDHDRASAVLAVTGKERAIRLRLTELLGPEQEWSASLVAALLTSFLSRAADYQEALADAINRQDADAVARDSHSMKGMAGNLGVTELAALGSAMESYGHSGEFRPASRLLAQMSAELDAVRPVMLRIIAS